MATHLSTKRTLLFMPPSTADEHPEIRFHIRIPTFQDKDDIGMILYAQGLRRISDEHIRALLVSELYVMREREAVDDALREQDGDLSDADRESARRRGEARAEEDAMFLDGVWQRQMLDQAALDQWLARQREAIADIKDGAPPLAVDDPDNALAEPRPASLVSARERARVTIMAQQVVDFSERVRVAQAEQQLYDSRVNVVMARMHIADVEGLGLKLEHRGGLVTDGSIEVLRERLQAKSVTAWRELVAHINQQYELPKVEKGNSDSPRENISPVSGSPETGGDPESSDGSMTTPKKGKSSIGRTRGAA